MENKLELTNKDFLDAIDKCNSDEDLFELEFCKKDSNEIEKIIADIFSDVKEIYENNKKMCLDLKQIIKLLKIREQKNIKSFDRDTFNKYKDILENVIVQNNKSEILSSDFMLLIRSFSRKDNHAYFEGRFANFIIQNIKQKFLNAMKGNDTNIISTENKIFCDDNGDKLTPDEMMLIRSKIYVNLRYDLDEWIWQQFIDSDWDLEQVFNFFKFNGDSYPMEPVTNLNFDCNELVDIDYQLPHSEELVEAIKKKMDLYAEQILSDQTTDYLTLEEIKVIAISHFGRDKNNEFLQRFLNRIPKQIDLCYFRYFVSIFVGKDLAEKNLIDQKFINSYIDRLKTNSEYSEYEERALYEIREVKERFEYWTPQATNLRIKENWEEFKNGKRFFGSNDFESTLPIIVDELKCKLKPGTLDPDLADTIIREMPKFKNKNNQKLLSKISDLIKAKRAQKNLIDSNAIETDRIEIINKNITTSKVYGKNNTGRPWYVILAHIVLGMFLWLPLLLNCMFKCCVGEPEEPNAKKIDMPTINSNTHDNQSNTASISVSTTDTVIQSSGKPGIDVDSNQPTKS